MGKELAKVADVAALDAQRGPMARISICVPREWTDRATTLVVDTPRMLSCERCHGGGCDSYGRSGALRAPENGAFDLTLPAGLKTGTLVRVPRPFDDDVIEQLIVEVRVGPTASKGIQRVTPAALAPTPAPFPTASAMLLFMVAVIVAIALLVVL